MSLQPQDNPQLTTTDETTVSPEQQDVSTNEQQDGCSICGKMCTRARRQQQDSEQ